MRSIAYGCALAVIAFGMTATVILHVAKAADAGHHWE